MTSTEIPVGNATGEVRSDVADEPPRPAAGIPRVGLRPGVSLRASDGGHELQHPWGRHRLNGLSLPELGILNRMIEGTVDRRLVDTERLGGLFRRLANLVTVSLQVGNRIGVTAVPVNRDATAPSTDGPVPATVRLSRFAYLHPPVGGLPASVPDGWPPLLALESPVSAHRFELFDPLVVAFTAQLAGTANWAEAAERTGLELGAAAGLVAMLSGAGLLDGQDEELTLWEFQDLLFHQRSRYGRHDYPAGGQFSHADRPHESALPPLPCGHDRPAGDVVELPTPQWQDVLTRDRTLTETIEGRRSGREYGQLITRDQLGELLYRTARARAVRWTSGEHPYEAVDRPYPTGGGMGELEIYLVVHRCADLESGVYHYDSAGHRLLRRDHDPVVQQALGAQAWLATGGQTRQPQLQLFVTSRLARLQWKYNAISYALTLKHVGVLFQNLYLVSTAMGLSACGNGSGDTEMLVRAAGLDPAREAPVGEFLIGGAAVEQPPVVTGFRDVIAETRAASG